MKINDVEVTGISFAYEGCHKIYICETMDDVADAQGYGYVILPLTELKATFDNACDLRFIRNWRLDVSYVGQGESARFE